MGVLVLPFDLYTLDHNRLARAAATAVPPPIAAAIGHLLDEGKHADAFALANIEVSFDFDKLPYSLANAQRAAFGHRQKEIDPRLLLQHFPRDDADPTQFLPLNVFLFRAPIATGPSSSARGSGTPLVELWVRVRPHHRDRTRLVIERVAVDARLERERWEAVPWRFSRRYQDTDAFIRDGAAFAFDTPASGPGRSHPPTDIAVVPDDPDAAAALSLALLDEDRIEEALMVCGIQLSATTEALLYGDIHTVFFERLKRMFPRAEAASLADDATRLAEPRAHLRANARRLLRQSAPWSLPSAQASVPLEWTEATADPIAFLFPLDAQTGPQSVWLGLRPGPLLDVFVAPVVPHVVASAAIFRSMMFEWRRFQLWPASLSEPQSTN